VHAAASHSQTSVRFIRCLIWDGDLPFIRAGKKFLIDKQDLDRVLCSMKERCGA
jgi:excisionase family DNA binding protein